MAILIVFVSACSKKSEYTNVIPANASTVASINVKSLAEKAGLNDKENKEAQQKLIESLKSGMNAATFQQVEMIIKDPKKSGIDISAPIYVFSTETLPATIITKVSNEEDLHALLETLEKENICQPLADGDGFRFTKMSNQVLLAYTPSVLILTEYKGNSQFEKIKESLPALLKQSAENSIVSTAASKRTQKMGGDINALLSPASLLKDYAKQISYGLPQDINLKDLQMLGSLSFDKGKISMKYENFTENPELQALFDKQKKVTRPIDNSFLKYFPKSTLMYFSMGINGEELYNLLLENEEFQQNFSIAKANEVKALFGTFQKDIAAGLLNVTMNNAPAFLLYANVKSAAPVQALYEKKNELGLRRGEDIIKLGENEYVYKSRMTNLFFGVRDNSLYATNDQTVHKAQCFRHQYGSHTCPAVSKSTERIWRSAIRDRILFSRQDCVCAGHRRRGQQRGNRPPTEREERKCTETDRKLHQGVCWHLITDPSWKPFICGKHFPKCLPTGMPSPPTYGTRILCCKKGSAT